MRRTLLTTPHLLAQRITEALTRRAQRRSLRNTAARHLLSDHLDTLGLLRHVQATTPPSVIFDVGANRGAWSLLARTVCSGAEVHAFEPLASLHDSFHRQTDPVGRVTLHGAALGRASGVAPMYLHRFVDSSSLLPLSPKHAARFPDHVQDVRDVQLTAMDDYVTIHRLPEPDLIKLDVQGYELEVLAGATRTLAHATAVIAEVSFCELYAAQPQFSDVAHLLSKHGFRVAGFGYGIPLEPPLVQTDVLFLKSLD